MAAQTTVIRVPGGQWTEITANDVEYAMFQNQTQREMFLTATTGAAPAADADGIMYYPAQGERKAWLADLFPGVTGAVRLWAYYEDGGEVFISHA